MSNEEKSRRSAESGSHKNRARAPLAFHAYLALALLLGISAWIQAIDPLFLVALGFVALAEVSIIRRSWEICGERAKRRMEWPSVEPPLRDGASQEEVALAWASIACRLSALGHHTKAAQAWNRSDEAMREPGQIPGTRREKPDCDHEGTGRYGDGMQFCAACHTRVA